MLGPVEPWMLFQGYLYGVFFSSISKCQNWVAHGSPRFDALLRRRRLQVVMDVFTAGYFGERWRWWLDCWLKRLSISGFENFPKKSQGRTIILRELGLVTLVTHGWQSQHFSAKNAMLITNHSVNLPDLKWTCPKLRRSPWTCSQAAGQLWIWPILIGFCTAPGWDQEMVGRLQMQELSGASRLVVICLYSTIDFPALIHHGRCLV